MIYIITLFVLALIVNFRIFKVNTSFFNISLNLLSIVGLYATYTTGFKSIFIVFLILIILNHINKIKLGYDKNGLIQSIIYLFLTTPIVYLFQYKNIHSLQTPYLDDVFYSRVPVWLDEIKAENVISHIHWMLNNSSPSPTFYHWFEIWMANLSDKVNGGNMYINLYIVVFSFISMIICIGLHSIVKDLFKNTKDYFIIFLSFIGWILILLINNHWDFLSIFSSIDISSYTYDKSIYNSLKLLYTVPICISIYYITTYKEKGIIYPLLFSFMYLTVFPAVLGATILGCFLLVIQKRKIKLEYLMPFIAAVLFYGFYKLTGESKIASYSTNVSSQIPTLSHAINWFVKAYVINPLGWIIPIFYLFSQRSELFKFITSFILLYISAAGLWLLLYLKIDSFQLFYNIINSMFSFITFLALIYLLKNKRYVLAIVFLIPILLPLQSIKSTELSLDKKNLLNGIEPYTKEKIIYINQPSDINTLYQHNETFYSFNPEVFIKYEEIQMLYLNASYPIQENMQSDVKTMVEGFRRGSKYFQKCGELDFQNYSCLIDFMKEYGFTTIFSEIKVENPEIHLVNEIEYLKIYQIK